MTEWGWLNQCKRWMYGMKVKLDEVLVEYEGPHLAIFTDDFGHLYFGIFCDYIDENYRWMLVTISNAEKIAIISGNTSLLDAIKKKLVYINDFDDNFSAVAVWHCEFGQLPASILPKQDQNLPIFAQRPISELVTISPDETLIKLDGPAIKNNSLPFKDFGHFLVLFQDYWEKISKATLPKPSIQDGSTDYRTLASLSFCAATEGSINIHFKPTFQSQNVAKLVDRTLTHMKSVKESGVPKKLVTALGKQGLTDAGKMHSLLHTSGIDMLLISRRTTLYVGAEKSGQISRTIRKTSKANENNQTMRGYFCAGRSKKSTHSFEFIDEQTGASFKGKISPLVWRYSAIAVGDAQYYEVEIEVYKKVKGDQTVDMSYLLVKAEQIQRQSLLENPS